MAAKQKARAALVDLCRDFGMGELRGTKVQADQIVVGENHQSPIACRDCGMKWARCTTPLVWTVARTPSLRSQQATRMDNIVPAPLIGSIT